MKRAFLRDKVREWEMARSVVVGLLVVVDWPEDLDWTNGLKLTEARVCERLS